MFSIVIILSIFSNKLVAQQITSKKCYRASNPEVLTIFTDSNPEVKEEANSAMVVYEYIKNSSSPSDPATTTFTEDAVLNIQVFSSSIYYTSFGISYYPDEKKFIGDCDAGTVAAQLLKNGRHLELTSEGYRGTALRVGECSNATLTFKKPLKLVELSDNVCKRKIADLPKLPEEEFE